MQEKEKKIFIIVRTAADNVPAAKLLKYIYAFYLEERRAEQYGKKKA